MTDIESWDGTGTLPVLFAKTASGAIQTWTCWVEDGDVCTRYGQQGGAMQDARYTCKPKNIGRSNETDIKEQARLEAISKWRKQRKKKGYFEAVDEAQNTLRLAPMLAGYYEDRKGKLTWPMDVQPKFNGLRCLAYKKNGRVVLQSRGGDSYCVGHVSAALDFLPEGIFVDGELYRHGVSLQSINSLARRPQRESIILQYYVYDMGWIQGLERAAPWTERKKALTILLSEKVNEQSILQLAPLWEVGSEPELVTLHDHLVRQGFEGAILRAPGGLYKFGHRSTELLKFKAYQDGEFEIIGWKTGKGRFANVPIFQCKTAEGKVFEAAMEGSMRERAQILAQAASCIGKQLTVRFFEWSEERTPLQPIGVNIRYPGT